MSLTWRRGSVLNSPNGSELGGGLTCFSVVVNRLCDRLSCEWLLRSTHSIGITARSNWRSYISPIGEAAILSLMCTNSYTYIGEKPCNGGSRAGRVTYVTNLALRDLAIDQLGRFGAN
jgi:hypothetical protein